MDLLLDSECFVVLVFYNLCYILYVVILMWVMLLDFLHLVHYLNCIIIASLYSMSTTVIC